MVGKNSLIPGQHYEVRWSDRHTPPAPGMVLLDERETVDGGRAMFVWGWRLASGWREIVCWSEPEHARVADTPHPPACGHYGGGVDDILEGHVPDCDANRIAAQGKALCAAHSPSV